MSAIGFLLHPSAPELDGALDVAHELGYATWTTVSDIADAVESRRRDTALLVTIGGDGTFLLGARVAAPAGIPVMGVNRGRLGFLTDVEREHLSAALRAFAASTHHVLERRMLSARVNGGDAVLALNEVVVRATEVISARLRVEVDTALAGHFDADGMVVATATGSTAYALSAGGPPVDPRVPAVVLVPLAAHGLENRALVLPDTSEVRIEVERGDMTVAADGMSWSHVGGGDVISVAPGIVVRQVVVDRAAPFVRRLRDKLRFGVPLKRERSGSEEDEHAG